jgi:protoheme IX farnesyltransferase
MSNHNFLITFVCNKDGIVEKSTSSRYLQKIRDYMILTKFTLSFTVVFSCVVCYMLAPNIVEYQSEDILLLFLAGLLITGSANAINQAVEKDTDAMMKRTAVRPVAAGRMSVKEANTFAFITGVTGIAIMYICFNLSAAMISAFSLFLYSYIYTPLKKISAVSVLVGALPGALPCLIGWVAATDVFSPFETIQVAGRTYSNAAGWSLFGLQFLWQFPHFWAIAWVAHEDYTKAGFKLLPSTSGPTKSTALQAVLYSVLLVPIGILPHIFLVSGKISLWIVIGCNLFMIFQCLRLYQTMEVSAARRVMFSSYFYLAVVLLALLADKN